MCLWTSLQSPSQVIVALKVSSNLVAPGCIVPQETHDDSRTDIKGYATAIDGVQYRIYFHDNEWKCSTSGRIIPNVFWGAKGTPTFEELFFDASDQWDNTALNKGYCYYVFLEHPKFTNIVKHSEIKEIFRNSKAKYKLCIAIRFRVTTECQ